MTSTIAVDPVAGLTLAEVLLDELSKPQRGFDAVVVGEPQRAFYGNQFGLTFPLFEHFDAPLWVSEVGGLVDPPMRAHELIMSHVWQDQRGRAEPDQALVRSLIAALA